MKTKRTLLWVFLVSVLLIPQAHAGTPVSKLAEGVEHIVTAPFQLVEKIGAGISDDNPFFGIVAGPIQGTGLMIRDIFAGLYDVVTFPFPVPANYESILVEDNA